MRAAVVCLVRRVFRDMLNCTPEDRPKKVYPAYWDADQLYDLSADPNEQRNLAQDPAHAARLDELKRELRRHLEKLPGGFAELKTAP